MLQAIRGTAGTWVVKILFIFLIISFGAWGIGGIDAAISQWVAKVGDSEITPVELDREFRGEVDRLRQMLGPDLTAEQARQLGLLEQTLQQLIQQRLVATAAADYGLRVSDEAAAADIRQVEAFRDPVTNEFSADVMRQVLARNSLTEQELLRQVKADRARVQLLGAVARGASAPQTLVAELYRYRGERRVADTLFVADASVPEPAAPDEAALKQFHQDRAVRYTAPEYRGLTVASLNADALMKEVQVTEEELRQAYDERVAEFVTPERRDIAQVVVDSKEKAEQIAAAAASGKSLADAAKAAGAEVVALEGVAKDDLPAEISGPAFELAQGAVSAAVESPLGWHVLSPAKVTPGGERPFEQVKAELETALRREKATDLMFERSSMMDDAIAGGASLEEAAQKAGAVVTKVAKVDNTGKDPAGKAVEGVAALPRVLEVAFAQASGDTSVMTEAPDGGYFAVRSDSVDPAALRPLDQVKDRVAADWKAEKRAEAAAAKAKDIAEKLRAGADPQKLAKETGATFARSEPLPRSGAVGNVPPGLKEELFTLQPGGVAEGEAEGGRMVAKLVEVLPADPAAAQDQIAAARATAADTVAGDLVAQFMAGLQQRFEVERNDQMLRTMYQEQDR
ncbi:MAG TPA: SurA N-terminal domain-containing protein [Alphaproteobacteria bacterium]|nr:SurA N-terminal domain-containing protein [Alphaproteobacteria bacterium]